MPADLSPLPCLYSNNGIENAQKGTSATSNESEKVETIAALTTLLSPYHKKAAQTLFLNVRRLITKEAQSINHVAFLTLTFPDNVTDHKEAHEKFRSFRTNYLSKHEAFGSWVHVKERQKRGAWHYHMIVVLKGDIRSGVNWEELAKGNYRSANPYLRALWQDLRENLEKYGFGRSELLPVRSNEEAMGRYIGKYISKHMGQREENDKGVRLVNYSRDWVKNSVKFAWNTSNAHEWRRKLARFAKSLGCEEIYQLSEKLGPGWVYKYLDDIMFIDQTCLERLFNDRSENYERIVPEFKSNTVKKTVLNQKQRRKAETDTTVNESHRRAKEKKKQETKCYMGRLRPEYVNEWVSVNKHDSLAESLKETKEENDRFAMKMRCSSLGKYNNEQEIFILETGEIVPF